MKPVLTADEYRRIDKAYTGDLDVAMDKAGYAVALAAARAGAGYGTRVVILAGPGNNGGDGYVAARYLKERGVDVEIQALGPPKTEESIQARESAKRLGVQMGPIGKPHHEDIVVDALFGGGVRDDLPDEILPWLDGDAPVVAVDFPTGLEPNSGAVPSRAFRAVETVTFGALKTGHVLGEGPDHCGTVTVADIGIEGGTPSMYVAEESDTHRPPRRRKTYKWDAGSVLVVGGSTGLVGAAVLAARGALNFGAGAVAIASPDSNAVISNTVEFPTFTLSEAVDHADRFDVLIFGPGLSEDDLDEAMPLLDGADRVLVDAGGLRPAVLDAITAGKADFILTPHAGEFKRMSGGASGSYAVRALARKLEGVVLLKGNPTRISDGGLPVLVDTGGPELATIGTGDVLAGMIAALWSRGSTPDQAALTGAYFHGAAGKDLVGDGPIAASKLAEAVRAYAW